MTNILDEICRHKRKEVEILKKNGLIVIHRHKKDDISLTNKLRIIDTRFYGISKIIFGI